jgi:hypothetical protein
MSSLSAVPQLRNDGIFERHKPCRVPSARYAGKQCRSAILPTNANSPGIFRL